MFGVPNSAILMFRYFDAIAMRWCDVTTFQNPATRDPGVPDVAMFRYFDVWLRDRAISRFLEFDLCGFRGFEVPAFRDCDTTIFVDYEISGRPYFETPIPNDFEIPTRRLVRISVNRSFEVLDFSICEFWVAWLGFLGVWAA